MLVPDGKNCVTGQISIVDLAREVGNIPDGDDDAGHGEERETEKVPGLQAQIDFHTLARSLLQRNGKRALKRCSNFKSNWGYRKNTK